MWDKLIRGLDAVFDVGVISTLGAKLLGAGKGHSTSSVQPLVGSAPVAKPQETSILAPRNDEAIQLALDAALSRVEPNGQEHLTRVMKVRKALKPHQRTDWRKNIGTFNITEKFALMVVAEIFTTAATDQGEKNPTNLTPLGQNRRGAAKGGPPGVQRRFERMPIDYALTEKDPRVQHLIMVSELVLTKNGEVETAIEYLLTAGLISDKSLEDLVKESLEGAKAAVVVSGESVYRTIVQLELGPEIYAEIKKAPTDSQEALLKQALKAKLEAIKQERQAFKGKGLPKWFWWIVAGIILVTILGSQAIFLLTKRP